MGCIDSASITVPVTQNLLIADPSVNIGSNISRWNAAFNPVVFTYQRRDFEISGIVIDTASGKPRLNINGDMSAISTLKTANNLATVYVYVNAGPYSGVFPVYSSDTSSIVIDTPYAGPATGFINVNLLRPYYKVVTKINYIDPLSGLPNVITSVNRPNNQGVIQADISNFLQSILRAKDDSNYSQVNYRDSNLSASYTIQYAEQYDDYQNPGTTLTSPYINIAQPYYVTYTARQIQSKNGGNLAQYVPFPAPSTPAKWVTDFIEPAYTNSYPFDISFIYSEALAGRQLYYEIILLDINRQPLPTNAITSYLLNDDGSWLLNQDASRLVIAAQNLVTVPVTEQIGLNRLRINIDMPLDVYYFNITLYYNDETNTPVQITQTQTISVDHAPDINAVYMRWIGLTGAVHHWTRQRIRSYNNISYYLSIINVAIPVRVILCSFNCFFLSHCDACWSVTKIILRIE